MLAAAGAAVAMANTATAAAPAARMTAAAKAGAYKVSLSRAQVVPGSLLRVSFYTCRLPYVAASPGVVPET